MDFVIVAGDADRYLNTIAQLSSPPMAPSDPLVLRSYSCPEIEYSSVSSRQSCTGVRSLPTRAPFSRLLSPARPTLIQSTIKHWLENSATNSESCGSSATPAGSTMDARERNVVLQLYASKYAANFSSDWRASDEHRLIEVQHELNVSHPPYNISMAELKAIVTSLEEKVIRYKEHGEELQNKETMLAVFNYILGPPIARQEGTEQLGPSRLTRVKRPSYPASSSHSNDSIQPEFYEVCCGPYNMAACTKKLERIGLDGDALYDAIDLFLNDLQKRQVFMALPDPRAITYASREVKKFNGM